MAPSTKSDTNQFAQQLFAGLPSRYDQLGYLLSLGQDRRWRRAIIEKVDASLGGPVLDVATGTGGVAVALRRATGAPVVGIDLSRSMLHEAQRHVGNLGDAGIFLIQGRAEDLPFAEDTFSSVVVTYLLRYVDDPAATVAELTRVLRPGGVFSSMEFHVPSSRIWRTMWWSYTRAILPFAGWLSGGRAWYRAGKFLGPNISAHYRRHSLNDVVRFWESAGMVDVRTSIMSLGGGVVIWGRKASGG